MALFGHSRDVLLINSINRELINDIITQQVGYYKPNSGATTVNMYGESTRKFFSDPVLINCLIDRGDQTWSSDELGPDVVRTVTFSFLRDDLKNLQLLTEVGDIIFYQENYYEVDSVVDNQLFVGKNPEYPYSEGMQDFGSSISIICQTHLVPADKVGLSLER